jgi:hypothetical protein
MAKTTRRAATPAGSRRAIAREIVRRAQFLHADAVAVIGEYYELAARYERLVTAVDVFWDDVAGVDDALWDVHESLGLQAVLVALEAAAQRFEEAGLATFAAGARAAFGAETPTLESLQAEGARIGMRGSGTAVRGFTES